MYTLTSTYIWGAKKCTLFTSLDWSRQEFLIYMYVGRFRHFYVRKMIIVIPNSAAIFTILVLKTGLYPYIFPQFSI